ncbi:hypothetical protein ACLOJK_023247 [Asimina triloba]
MAAGRKTQKFTLSERNPPAASTGINSSFAARNLRKNDLGGVIFGCKHSTVKECLSKQLFGLPASHFAYVRNIDPGLPLFLFNYSDRTLHGIFESASPGQMNIDPYGWTEDGSERTPFPSQVENLMLLFKSRPLTGSIIPAHGIAKRNSLLDVLPNDKLPGAVNGNNMNTGTANQKGYSRPSADRVQADKYETLPWDDSGNDCESLSKAMVSTQEVREFNLLVSQWDSSDLECVHKDIGSSSAIPSLNGGGQTLESQSQDDPAEKYVDDVLSKLTEMVVDHDHLNILLDDRSTDVAGPSTIGAVQQDEKQFPNLSLDQVECEKVLMIPSNPHCDMVQLREGMEMLKNIVLDQLQRTRALETRLTQKDLPSVKVKYLPQEELCATATAGNV